MDELVHHCLRELAFDGDLGCHPSRLRDFVTSYHSDSRQQAVDDAYFAFVWSLVVCQPTVRVGTVPDGATTEVYIAPQQSQRRKSKEKDGVDDTSSVTPLTLLPDARSSTLDDLQSQYGDSLRISVDAETSFAATTGSHICPPKLTPMVYTALQFITRGREHGISTVDLGKKTGYDQKTCFYLIKQLLELELVVKLRRGGVGTNFCVHRYFFERSPLWRQIQDEGANLSKDLQADGGGLDNEETVSTQGDLQAPVQFDPIDARHLSSLSLIQSRVVKLLRHSKSYTHPSQNLLVTIGFLNPTKTDRRFFQSRLRELIEARVVERVMVPSTARGGAGSIPCIRLISDDNDAANELNMYPSHVTPDPSTHDVLDGSPSTIKLNITLHKQMINLLENAGPKGMTLNEISAALGNFDRRTLELLLTKLEKVPPPPHLSDLRIVQLMETHGRERRWRYFTLASYRAIIANEKLDDQDGPYSSLDFSGVGNFAPFVAEDFYSDVTELNRFMDYAFSKSGKAEDSGEEAARKRTKKTTAGVSALADRKKKRKREEAGLDTDAEGSVRLPKKRGRPRKHPPESQLDAPVKGVTPARESGHSRKPPGESVEATLSGGTSRVLRIDTSREVPKKRHRPPDDGQSGVSAPEGSARPRRRGRPSKRPPSPPFTGEAAERSPSRERACPPGVHTTCHPVSEPPLLPSKDNAGETGVQSSSRGRDIASQGSSNREPPVQPEFTLSCSPNVHSTEGPGTTIDNHHRDLPQSKVQHADPKQTDIILEELDAESGTTVRMGSSSNQGANAVIETSVGESARTRAASESSSAPQKRREKTAAPYSRSNVSLLRRENEFFRILEESGGIVLLGSKEFLDAHLALLDALASAGEPTSGLPGIKVDKRTIENTFESLERRGKVKVLKTALSTVTGAQRPARIIYSPAVDQSRLDTFLAELGNGPHGTPYSTSNPTPAGAPPGELKARRPAQPLRLLQSERGVENIGQWSKNSGRADQLFGSDDQTIHDVLLTERTTLAQLYGFIPGKMMRARELHLATLDALQSCDDSPIPISPAKRVVKFSQYFQGLPIWVYCSVVSTLVQSDELSQILSTEEGRRTPVKDLPPSLRTLLQIGRARSRERLLELFEILHQLNLAVPLQPSDSSSPLIRCEFTGDDPSSFDAFTGDVSTRSYRSAPDYWLFHHEAALYLWALSAESPPFWKTASVRTRLDAVIYWNELQPVCGSKTFAQSLTPGSPSQPIAPNAAFARSITRDASWNRAYDLSWHQRQYLKRFISRQGGDTPLQDEEDTPTLERVSWITSAPLSIVKDFLQKERSSQLRELDKARLRTPGNEEPEHAEKMAQEKELLAKKVAASRARKEREWQAILNAVHPAPLEGVAATRVARVRKRYLQSGVANDRSRWEGEVRDAIRQLQSATKAILPSAQRSATVRPSRGLTSVPIAVPPPEATAAPTRPAGLPPVVVNQPGKSIELLIAEQGPAREEARKRKRKKKGGDDVNPESENVDDDGDQSHRRSRFLWNKEYDELAQDASAILRVRLREAGGRMDWFALRQVFPAVPRNSVRQRIASLREVPSNEVYMRRLEDQWYRLWKQYRGSEHLPDPHPQSQTDFDLIKHLQFLRNFVDKNALRVGFEETSTTFVLPETVSQLHSSWDVLVKPDNSPVWEFLWESKVDENREKGLLQTAFTTDNDDAPTIRGGPSSSQEVQVAEAALKMVFGTPNESYDPSRAAALLHSVGERPVSKAKDNLLSRGVLSKLVRGPQKSKPGRTLKISEINQNALGGSIPQDVFQDATTLDALCKQHEPWREWPLLASDGDLAMLAQITSEGLVDFKLDITKAKAARIEIDWNSKKADDDHIETTIFTRLRSMSISDAEDAPASEAGSPSAEIEDSEEHGKTTKGTVACCRKYSEGQVNCDSCLSTALRAWADQTDTKEQEVARGALDILDAAGAAGLDMSTLLAKTMEQGRFDSVSSLAVLESLMDNPIPPIIFVGHSRPRVVCSHQSDAWTVTVSEEPRINVLPRRWLDLRGVKVRETWRAALRAVIGTIVFRPGIPQAEILWRLRSVYDGAEVVDVLRQLCGEGFVRRKVRENRGIYELGLVPVMEREDREVYWFLGDRRWYQVVAG